MQNESIAAGIAVGMSSLTSGEYRIQDLVAQGQAFFDERAKRQIKDILIIDNEWRVTDSLSDDYLPVQNDDGSVTYKYLSELTDLPPLMEIGRLGDDATHFPNARSRPPAKDEDEAHAIPVETSKGRWYVMVLLHNDPQAAARRAAQPLIYTLGILMVSTLITFYLVWRFTRPIANL